MPRQPDPDLEKRVLKAAHALWKRAGGKALTMRAVAKAAGTNTPAVYRRFKDREDLVVGLLRSIAAEIRQQLEVGETVEDIAETYVNYALRQPHEYELFYSNVHALSPRKGTGQPRPIRETRPNFGFVEARLSLQLGGSQQDHTQLALAMWALLHGTTSLLLSKAIPEGHEEELRAASRTALKTLLDNWTLFAERK